MRKIQLYNKAFTLVEVLISITIFSVIITSIIWIYVISSDIILKSDINRIMQENLKNVSNTIAEDIRKNGILGVSISSDSFDTCNNNIFTNNYKV
jgi:prepilin-type N-terminal cleavage/methylation domain-containing protein